MSKRKPRTFYVKPSTEGLLCPFPIWMHRGRAPRYVNPEGETVVTKRSMETIHFLRMIRSGDLTEVKPEEAKGGIYTKQKGASADTSPEIKRQDTSKSKPSKKGK